jgi:imidazolonepropionase-like amidohydrolase
MQLFVERIGMSPLEAITCGTRNAAFTVDADNVGTLEPGKWADVLVVDGDPLEDIRILQNKSAIHAVFKAGAAVDLAPHARIEKWPWERIMTVSGTELCYETVYGTQT